MKINTTILVLIKMTIKMTLMSMMMTRIVLTMISKEIKPCMIKTISYLKIAAVMIVV